MGRGKWLIGAVAVAWISPAPVWGQASFGPIQPFAGAPTPVYVAAPYAAPTVLAPLPAPAAFTPTPTEIQIPAASVAPSLTTAPAPVVPLQPVGGIPGCGSSPYYRLPLAAPAGTYQAATPVTVPGWGVNGWSGQRAAYVADRPTLQYRWFWSP